MITHNTITSLTLNAGKFCQLNIQRIQSKSLLLFIIKFSKHYGGNEKNKWRSRLLKVNFSFLNLDLLSISTYIASVNFKTILYKNDQINHNFNSIKENDEKSKKT